MNSKYLIPLFLFVFLLSFCEKENPLVPANSEPPRDSTDVVSPPDTSSSEPGDTTTTAPPDTTGQNPADTVYSAFGAYFPIGEHHRWLYESRYIRYDDVNLTVDTTLGYPELSVRKDTIVEGRQYVKLSDDLYIRIRDGRYFQYFRSPEDGSNNEWIFLDENAEPGARWTTDTLRYEDHPVEGPVYVYFAYELAEKEGALEVNDITYEQVITIFEDRYMKLGEKSFDANISRRIFYYSRDIGLIREYWEGFNVKYERDLISFDTD